MRKSSLQIIFINTSPPNERVELLKPIDDIKNVEDNSEEIYTAGLLNRYCKRPQKLENLTLADSSPPQGAAQIQLPFDLIDGEVCLQSLVFHDSSNPVCCASEGSAVV